MPLQVVWTKSALDDLSAILTDRESPHEQNELEEAAFHRAGLLAEQPLLGSVFEPLGRGYRQIVVHPNYRLVYAVSDRVYILAFIHSRREWSSAWKERPRTP